VADQISLVEQHPIHHDWYRVEDIITARNSRHRVIEVSRHEYCSSCGTTKITKVDTNVWELKGRPRYKYAKGQTIVRVGKNYHLRKTFTATSNLPEVKDLGR
jgi:ribosomal protein L37AE/L43A